MPSFAQRALVLALTIAAAVLAGVPAASAADGDAPPAATPRIEERTGSDAAALDERFRALKVARSEEESDPIVADIWALWLKSGDTIVDEMMQDAITASRLGARDRALQLLEEVLRRKPEFAEAWNQRATIRFFEGRDDEALQDCVEVLKREPRHFGALAGMALIAVSREDHAAALSALRRAVDLHPFLKERALIRVLETKVDGKPL